MILSVQSPVEVSRCPREEGLEVPRHMGLVGVAALNGQSCKGRWVRRSETTDGASNAHDLGEGLWRVSYLFRNRRSQVPGRPFGCLGHFLY